ncbi:conserved hypothetical protein [Leishmania major strain Friedlin]|uniref:Pre-rRNA-processing protein TSR2 homolog n=1 Tax=Leishmania major TaxID=5664 RepID=E9AD90_LEIMA|nr:conserved hypothetical protein [Leishmania major strain Friedlin]CAG9576715.1 hypothetical_protein_-_conserved [Leishmania major strain Friedlin]CBZ12175.1 conserved hypothetical protein [Leishmania major strain Friedlin]|eukprot:XP_003721919.1 conserved hypothetical protein [Leishmania major strain Friedlin]
MQSNSAPVSYGAQLRASMQTLRANDTQFEQFTRGLGAVLQQWTALQLVAQHCDSRAPAVLYEDLCAWHKHDGEVYVDDMEVYFEEFFDNIRSARIEDDSMQEVGTVLHDMYCRCCLNDFSLVEHYLETLAMYVQTNPVAMSVNGGTNENLEDDAEEDAELGGDAVCEEGVDNEDEESEPMQAPTPKAPQQPPQPPRHQQQPQRKKRKNTSVRSRDGWNIVQ